MYTYIRPRRVPLADFSVRSSVYVNIQYPFTLKVLELLFDMREKYLDCSLENTEGTVSMPPRNLTLLSVRSFSDADQGYPGKIQIILTGRG